MNHILIQLDSLIKIGSLNLPIERIFCNLIRETPLPPQGCLKVIYSGLYAAALHPNPELKVTFSRPPPNKLPMFSSSYEPLFKCLSPENILTIYAAMLTEQRILFYSKTPHNLTIVAESFVSLLFPFKWHHIYIPLLVEKMVEFVCAPMPFIVGALTSYLPDDSLLDEVVVVSLDQNTIECSNPSLLTPLPDRRYNSLLRTLSKVTGSSESPLEEKGFISSNMVQEIREAFLKNICHVLKDYKKHIAAPGELVVEKFDKDAFLNKHSDNGATLQLFMESQMFMCFVDDRFDQSHRTQDAVNQFEILLFDESINVYCRNKKSAFLNDSSQYHDDKPFTALEPDINDLPEDYKNSKHEWPNVFHTDAFGTPRPVRPLTDEKMKSVNANKVDVSSLSMTFFTNMRLYSVHFRTLKVKTMRQESVFRDIIQHVQQSQTMDERQGVAYENLLKEMVESKKTDTSIDQAWQSLREYVTHEAKGAADMFHTSRNDVCIPLYQETGDISKHLKNLFDEASIIESKTANSKLKVDQVKKRSVHTSSQYAKFKNNFSADTEFTESDTTKIISFQKQMEDSHLSLDETETNFQTVMRQYETKMPTIIEKVRKYNLDRINIFQAKMKIWAQAKRAQLEAQLQQLDKFEQAVDAISVEEDLKSFSEGTKDFWSSKEKDSEENENVLSDTESIAPESETETKKEDNWDLRNSTLLHQKVWAQPRPLCYELDLFGK